MSKRTSLFSENQADACKNKPGHNRVAGRFPAPHTTAACRSAQGGSPSYPHLHEKSPRFTKPRISCLSRHRYGGGGVWEKKTLPHVHTPILPHSMKTSRQRSTLRTYARLSKKKRWKWPSGVEARTAFLRSGRGDFLTLRAVGVPGEAGVLSRRVRPRGQGLRGVRAPYLTNSIDFTSRKSPISME